MSSSETLPTLENPTREFLNTNYKKTELQKYCRDIGITKVWYTKDKIIDIILEKHRSSKANDSESNVQNHELTIQEVMKGIEELKERINIRDLYIDELNELMKAAHITINKLNDRVSSLEEQVKILQGTYTVQQTPSALQDVTPTQPLPEGTLLLGDTNLSPVRMSDLHQQCSIRTIKEANIDLINCWVSEKLRWAPKYCILVCGIQDILDGSQPVDIFDKLGSLITNLKQVNEEMTIHIHELAPIARVEEFDERINHFNNQLSTWSENNGVTVIKTNLQFRLGTGDVDRMCYSENNGGNFLNRFGIIRLLNIIAKQCPFFKLDINWDKITSQSISTTYASALRQQRPDTSNNDLQSNTLRSRNNDRHRQHHSKFRNFNQHNNNGHYSRRGPQQFSIQHSTHDYRHQGHQNRQILSDTRGWRQNSNMNPSNYQYDRLQRYPQGLPQSRKDSQHFYSRQPCSNCGELNHALSDCRFNYKLKCDNCREYGHKTRLCPLNA